MLRGKAGRGGGKGEIGRPLSKERKREREGVNLYVCLRRSGVQK